ncbi:MAG TPA: ABC transporter ATP-binding protein [Cryomorphaceae bacterium]|nr:ABC transporter ATP-binding protein [Cryomorphaceae bacterium]
MTIEAKNIDVSYGAKRGKRKVIKNFSTKLNTGETLVVIGSNGAGKSTLLRTLAGVQDFQSGELLWNDTPIGDIKKDQRPHIVSAMFSNYLRVDGFTVLDLVALGRQPYTGVFGKLKPADWDICKKALVDVGMENFENRQIFSLSDGEYKKVLLAKMLAQDTPVLIFDEPTTHLDLPSSIEFMKLIKKLASQAGKIAVFSTHNLHVAFQLFNTVLLLGEDGQYVQGAVDEIANHELTCSFLRTTDVKFEKGKLIYNIQ